ncbi:MAG TPA: sarcosine oxidase subunit gamma family protein [Rhizomicrobium sp.]|nr:sarcosine oxidase subunit gamma family protein [Rhizomicrobium sp.]
MSDLNAAPAFAGMKDTGSGGGVHVALRQYPIVSVLARKDQAQALMDKTGMVDAPRQSGANGVAALGIGPGRWLCLHQSMDQLAPLSGMASLSDHSDGYAVFELWGSEVRKALAKGVPVDLHPTVFTDDVAVTVIAHIGAIVWQSAPDRFSIAIFRSYAESFWHWLATSAAEFGLVMDTA